MWGNDVDVCIGGKEYLDTTVSMTDWFIWQHEVTYEWVCNCGWPGETLAAWLLMAPQSLAIPLPPPPSCHLCPLLPLEHDDCVHGGRSARNENKIEREEGESWTVCWFNCNVCKHLQYTYSKFRMYGLMEKSNCSAKLWLPSRRGPVTRRKIWKTEM